MKQFFMLLTLTMSAQLLVAQNNFVKTGIGFMTSPYENVYMPGLNLMLQRKITPGLWLSVGLGAHARTYALEHRTVGFDQTGSWDRLYSLIYKERALYTDVQVIGEAMHFNYMTFKIGAGVSAMRAFYDRPAQATLARGMLVNETRRTGKATAALFNVSLELEAPITYTTYIGIRSVYRTRVNGKHPVSTIIQEENGSQTLTSSLWQSIDLMLNIGYRF